MKWCFSLKHTHTCACTYTQTHTNVPHTCRRSTTCPFAQASLCRWCWTWHARLRNWPMIFFPCPSSLLFRWCVLLCLSVFLSVFLSVSVCVCVYVCVCKRQQEKESARLCEWEGGQAKWEGHGHRSFMHTHTHTLVCACVCVIVMVCVHLCMCAWSCFDASDPIIGGDAHVYMHAHAYVE